MIQLPLQAGNSNNADGMLRKTPGFVAAAAGVITFSDLKDFQEEVRETIKARSTY